MRKKIVLAGLLLAVAATAGAQTYNTLGIGIASPQGTLHVHNGTQYHDEPGENPEMPTRDSTHHAMYWYNTLFHITNGETGTTGTDGFTIDQYNMMVTLKQNELDDMTLENHDARIVLAPNGKVGVGAVSAGAHKFNVQGSASITQALDVSGMTRLAALKVGGENIYLRNNGNVEIGGELTVGSGFRCGADGSLKVKNLRVTLSDWSDYVFEPDYRLMPLDEVERYVQENRHLPDIPSAQDVKEAGVDVGEMNKLLLQKVEEMTLYIIDLQKQIDDLKSNK